jgi:sugar phosphate isomerase/epimerase
LFAIGHTWYEMRYAFPNKKIREIFIKELKSDLLFFNKIGCSTVAVHLDDKYKQIPKDKIFSYHLSALDIMASYAEQLSMQILVENVPNGKLSNPKDISKLLKANSNIGLLLDIGHANTISQDAIWRFFKLCGKRIRHIHMSDNNGTDEHLPIGLGSIDLEKLVMNLIKINYKGTVTLEMFARNAELDMQLYYQKKSRDLFLKLINKHV